MRGTGLCAANRGRDGGREIVWVWTGTGNMEYGCLQCAPSASTCRCRCTGVASRMARQAELSDSDPRYFVICNILISPEVLCGRLSVSRLTKHSLTPSAPESLV